MKKRILVLAVAGLIAVAALSAAVYEAYRTPRGADCPAIFADVAFNSYEGFVTVTYPSTATTEFVLAPDEVGQITVSYSSAVNNLTANTFAGPVPAWKVNLTNGTLFADKGLNVTVTSQRQVSVHQVLVNYTLTSGPSTGVYVLGLPSTCLTTIVSVGNQPYNGPLTWLNGVRA
jgi:hypothetical protein